jgi:diamine N-acetyltransferase
MHGRTPSRKVAGMIELKDVDRENYRKIIGLKVGEGQSAFVDTNAFYLAQASYEKDCHPFGIYEGDLLVGFCMYCIDEADGQYWISQLMIDKGHQSHGYGRAALGLMLELIKADENHGRIYLSFEPENEWAKSLYESMGFVWDKRMAEEDLVYRLDY